MNGSEWIEEVWTELLGNLEACDPSSYPAPHAVIAAARGSHAFTCLVESIGDPRMAGADAPGVSLVLPVTIVRHMIEESAQAKFDEAVAGQPDRMPFVALQSTGYDVRFLPEPT